MSGVLGDRSQGEAADGQIENPPLKMRPGAARPFQNGLGLHMHIAAGFGEGRVIGQQIGLPVEDEAAGAHQRDMAFDGTAQHGSTDGQACAISRRAEISTLA